MTSQQIQPITKDGYWLLHDGADALADIEENGMVVDVEYCEKELPRLAGELKSLENAISSTDLGRRWMKKTKGKLNPDNNAQLAEVLYKDMGLTPAKYTESGESGATDEDALNSLAGQLSELDSVLRWRKLKKARDFLSLTYREQVDGIVHPFFNLHTVASFRSSCNGPNDQQQPNRDAEQQRIVRASRMPRPGNFLAELDYKSLEVNVGCPYHQDKNMIKYVTGAGDMHRDMAAQILKLPAGRLPKDARKLVGKGGFVFPEFYGSRWFAIAPVVWEALQGMYTDSGKPVVAHLAEQGIKGLGECRRIREGYRTKWWCTPGSFYEHIRNIESYMWDEVFPGYRGWREQVWADYQRCGYMDSLTGFRFKGVMSRNQVINFPIQGAAFHILLFSLIKLNNRLKTEGWKTKIVGQIHDSIVLDVYPREWRALKKLANRIVKEEIPREWPWINVPLTLEAERTPVNGRWHELEEVGMN